MKLSEFPGCCTAFVANDFGGTNLSSGKKGYITKVKIRAWLKATMEGPNGHACIVVMTNDVQHAANSVLLELGFKHSAWMSKTQHPGSKIRLWWKEP